MSGAHVYKVLIICSEPSKLEGVARFLVNRGWQSQIEKSVRQAIEAVVKYKPDFVLMSVNHPQAAPEKLYPMLQQYGLRVLPFAETNDARTYSRLQAYPQSTVLYPPMSGPSVYRKIQLFVKGEEDDARERERRHQVAMERRRMEEIGLELRHQNEEQKRQALHFSDVTTSADVKGGDSPTLHGFDGGLQEESRSGPEGLGDLVSYFQDSSPGETSNTAETYEGQVTQGSPTGKPLANELSPGVAAGAEVLDDMFDSKGSGGGDYENPFQDWDMAPQHSGPRGEQVRDLPGRAEALAAGEVKGSWPQAFTEQPATREGRLHVMVPNVQPSGGGVAPAGKVSRVQEHRPDFTATPAPKIHEGEPLVSGPTAIKPVQDNQLQPVAEATRDALHESSDLQGPVRRTGRRSRQVDLYAIKSRRGENLVALSDNAEKARSGGALPKFESRLHEKLKEQGEEPQAIEKFSVSLEESTVEDVIDAGDFAYAAVHEGEEVILSYLSGSGLLPEVVDAPQKMTSVPLDSFEPDKKVDFEVFLYLVTNNRYYRYLKPGRSLSAKQIAKLQTAKMARLFVRNEDVSKFKGHHIKNRVESGVRKSGRKKTG